MDTEDQTGAVDDYCTPLEYDRSRTWDKIVAGELLSVIGADDDKVVLASDPMHVQDAWGREAIAELRAVAGRDIPYSPPQWVREGGAVLGWEPTHCMPLTYAEAVERGCAPCWVNTNSGGLS
ncbi:hypothetical protein P7L78_26585 [Tistrella bauzanensis]|uniref:hypothetical protein n=1 Tax=Tistrella TaxID=171436 RepID=UPI0031F6317C